MTSFSFKLKNALHWLDNHLLIIICGFLLAFIPLYPKIPLWSPIEQYIVRVRLEDFFIVVAVIVWGIQVLRKKVAWVSPMLWMIMAYAVIGLISSLVAIFVIKTVPLQPLHVEKTFLHYFRYLEYFSLYVMMYSAVRRRSDLIAGISILVSTVFAISVYGYGQRYFYWPVYSTMNREFSKGIKLYLTEFARVQSTFAGHYDMAAYLVVVLPIVLAFAFQVKRNILKAALYVTFWLGTWLLILSASRTAFAAFMVGVMIVIFTTSLTKLNWAHRAAFVVSRILVFGLLSSILFYYFGSDLTARLNYVVNSQPQLKKITETLTVQRQKLISDKTLAMLPLSPTQLQKMLPKGQPPRSGESPDAAAAAAAATKNVASHADQPPSVAVKPSPTPTASPKPSSDLNALLPGDVHDDTPEPIMVATVSATGQITYISKTRKRVYSKCALEKELSLCIRQETLWPRAIEGFLTNPLTGSGYATLTKENVDQFTEADSTDNNFLRTLGETGILGFATFYGCIGIILYITARHIRDRDYIVSGYSIGLLGGSIGLLLNAVYIDVFAASKVAQSYWAIAGLLLGYLAIRQREQAQLRKVTASTHVTNQKSR